ncbi:polysaccharide deacetylase family protein (plasmid) [Haloferacaceae archaeon DSL9]
MGTVVLSVDAELGWGFHDHESPPTARMERARWGWQRLVDLLESVEIPATWAIVGHLFLDDCDGRHEDHPVGSDWFERERRAWSDRRDLRFGRDLIDALFDGSVDHDIGCHTFSHVEFGRETTTQEIVRAEMIAFVEATLPYDFSFDSFIFPRNNIGHRDVLAEWGFSCYRGRQPRWGPRGTLGERLRKVANATVSAPPIVEPTIDEYGLVNIPASLFLFGFEGAARRACERAWADPVVRQAVRGIDRAARTDGIFHMWLHPNNIVTSADVDRLRTIFDHVADARDRGDIDVLTMSEVAARTRSSGRARVRTTVD